MNLTTPVEPPTVVTVIPTNTPPVTNPQPNNPEPVVTPVSEPIPIELVDPVPNAEGVIRLDNFEVVVAESFSVIRMDGIIEVHELLEAGDLFWGEQGANDTGDTFTFSCPEGGEVDLKESFETDPSYTLRELELNFRQCRYSDASLDGEVKSKFRWGRQVSGSSVSWDRDFDDLDVTVKGVSHKLKGSTMLTRFFGAVSYGGSFSANLDTYKRSTGSSNVSAESLVYAAKRLRRPASGGPSFYQETGSVSIVTLASTEGTVEMSIDPTIVYGVTETGSSNDFLIEDGMVEGAVTLMGDDGTSVTGSSQESSPESVLYEVNWGSDPVLIEGPWLAPIVCDESGSVC